MPSATIITVAMGIPALATRTINRAIHDGNPTRRNYTQQEPHGVLYHYRDTQHSKPSFWHNNIKVQQEVRSPQQPETFPFRRTNKAMGLSTGATLWRISTRAQFLGETS